LHVVDTIALVKYFEDALPPAADSVFKSAEEGRINLIVPSIVIGEFLYLALKGRLKTEDSLATITELVSDIESSRFLIPVDMEISDWKVFLELKVPELHDRMICALAIRHLAESIVTNDPEIEAEKRISTTW
jgi:predicted nucleic acid-binding protein